MLYKLITSRRDNKDFYISIARVIDDHRDECTKIFNRFGGRFQLNPLLKNVFGFAEDQEKANVEIDYNITLKNEKQRDNVALARDADVVNRKIKMRKYYLACAPSHSKCNTLRFIE